MNTVSIVRLILESSGAVVGIAIIVLALRLAWQLRKLTDAELSTQLFLEAAAVRKFVILLAAALVLFVTMPLSILGYLVTEAEYLEVVHDVIHLLFLGVILLGVQILTRVARTELSKEADIPAEADLQRPMGNEYHVEEILVHPDLTS